MTLFASFGPAIAIACRSVLRKCLGAKGWEVQYEHTYNNQYADHNRYDTCSFAGFFMK